MDKHSPLAVSAAMFALAIRAKRDILQTLFYATRSNAADAWAFHKRLENLEHKREGGGFVVSPGNIMPRHELVNAKTAAEATAQDSALALMLIVDYSLQRFHDAAAVDTRTIGDELADGVKLNAVIWALANQARHLHEWQRCGTDKLEANPSVKIIRALKHDPLNPNVAREVLCGLEIGSYVDFEEMLLTTAHEALKGSGSILALVTAGTFILDADRETPDLPAVAESEAT